MRALVAHRFADEHLHALGLGDRPTTFVEHLAQHTIGDGLAVDQHAIAIEKHRFKHVVPLQLRMSPST